MALQRHSTSAGWLPEVGSAFVFMAQTFFLFRSGREKKLQVWGAVERRPSHAWAHYGCTRFGGDEWKTALAAFNSTTCPSSQGGTIQAEWMIRFNLKLC